MKLFYLFYKTALHVAVEKKNIEMIQVLLSSTRINANVKDKIFFVYFLIKFQIKDSWLFIIF